MNLVGLCGGARSRLHFAEVELAHAVFYVDETEICGVDAVGPGFDFAAVGFAVEFDLVARKCTP